MGKFSVEGKEPPRRPLYLLSEDHPYTPEQKHDFLEAHTSASSGRPVDQHWPRVKAAALECESTLLFLETRKPSRNAWARMNTAVQAGKLAELVETHPEDANGLLYGAKLAGVITPAHERHDYEDEFVQLCRLGADDRKAALAAAKGPGSVLWMKTGRPSGGPIEDFATFLGKLYVETTGRPLSASLDHHSGEFKGPAVRFMRAGLAPFPPELESAGLRSLIRRVKARLQSSKP